MQPARPRLGQLLVDAHILSGDQLEHVLALQKSDGRRLGTLLVESGLATETQITQILSQQLSVPWVSLYHIDFSRELLNLVSREVAERYCLVPIYVRPVRGQGDTLYLAMEDPMNDEALRMCTESSRLPTRAMIAAPSDISKAIRLYYGATPGISVTARPVAVVAAPVVAEPLAAAPSIVAAAPPAKTEAEVAPEAPSAADPAAEPPPPSSRQGSPQAPIEDDDTPSLEVRGIELPRGPRRRPQLQLTLLDGTQIKLPTGRKGGAAKNASALAAPEGELTAADLLAALRAAAHGADATEILGDNLRWEKMFAAILSLLLRKHLIMERELIEELKKI